ncbi:synaptonemal complex protein 1-like [Passerculus sandwichensis]
MPPLQLNITRDQHLVDNLREGDKEHLKKKLPSVDRAVARRYRTAKELIDTIEALLTFHIKGPNPETTNELVSKLFKEAEKIKHWKLTVETELNQKERKLQENRKIIDAQKKAIQELQFENEKLHLKLEDEICENKDLLKEAAALRHLCNLLKETCTRFTEKTRKNEQEKEATKQLYEELHCNIERMTVAFEELRVQAENNRLEMSFKLKEEAEKVDKFEKECKLEVSQKEKQVQRGDF